MILETWRRLRVYLLHPRRRMAAIVSTSLLGATSEALVLVLVVAVAMLAAGQTSSLPEIPGVGVALEPAFALGVAAVLGLVNIGAHVLNSRAVASVSAEVLETTRQRTLSGFFNATWSKQSVQRDGELTETAGVLAERLSTVAVIFAIGLTSAVQMGALLGAIVNSCGLGFVVRRRRTWCWCRWSGPPFVLVGGRR